MTSPPSTAQEATDARKRRGALRFLEALAAVALAAVASFAIREELSGTRLLLFWVASVYGAWRGGLSPALVASSLGVVLANYTVVEPFGAFAAPTVAELLSGA